MALTFSADRRIFATGAANSFSGDAHHLERCGSIAYVPGAHVHVQGESQKTWAHVHWRVCSPGHQRSLQSFTCASNSDQWSNTMNAVHVQRDSAPSTRHPIDRICDAERAIRSIAVVLDYAMEKNAADGDGPADRYFRGCLDAIKAFAGEIRESLDEMLDDRATERRRAAA